MTSTQAEQLQTIYNKLCSTDGKTIYKLGTGRSFNITEIVGEENISKYTIGNFIVAIDTLSGQTNSLTLDSSDARCTANITRTSTFTLDYNTSTGDFTITGGVYTLHVWQTPWSHIYTKKTINATPIVYFCPDQVII